MTGGMDWGEDEWEAMGGSPGLVREAEAADRVAAGPTTITVREPLLSYLGRRLWASVVDLVRFILAVVACGLAGCAVILALIEHPVALVILIPAWLVFELQQRVN